MPIPWSLIGLLLRYVGPSVPDIISTVKSLKKEQQLEKVVLDDTAARVLEVEKRLAAQLQLIEQLTAQIAKLEKAFVWALWAAVFALVLAGLALGVVFWK